MRTCHVAGVATTTRGHRNAKDVRSECDTLEGYAIHF